MAIFDVTQLSDEDIEMRLNQIDKRRCRFGANVVELEEENQILLNELINRGYKIKNIDIN